MQLGVVNVAMTFVAIWLIDRVERKPLLLTGLVGMVASLTILGLSTLVLSEPSSPTDAVAIITLAKRYVARAHNRYKERARVSALRVLGAAVAPMRISVSTYCPRTPSPR